MFTVLVFNKKTPKNSYVINFHLFTGNIGKLFDFEKNIYLYRYSFRACFIEEFQISRKNANYSESREISLHTGIILPVKQNKCVTSSQWRFDEIIYCSRADRHRFLHCLTKYSLTTNYLLLSVIMMWFLYRGDKTVLISKTK